MNDQKNNETILLFGLAIFTSVFILSLIAFYRDIKFYSANHWDFEKESDVRIRWGSQATGPGSISAKQKFYFAYPLAFLVSGTGAVVLVLELIKAI
jgi:hypothetical protein